MSKETTDCRNFRMLYYEQLGLRNVDQKKALEILLSEDPLDQEKLKIFSQQFILPAVLRPVVWKVLLNITPIHKESMEFVVRERQGQYNDLKQALATMNMISIDPDLHEENQPHKTIVLMYLLENGMLSVLHKNIRKKDGHKVFVLESICKIVCEIIHNECDAYWISKYMFKEQEQFISLFVRLPKYVKYYLQLEDKRLFEHLCEIQLFKMLPYDKWFQTYFAPVFSESLVYLEKVIDKLVAGSCNILVFVFVAMLLTFSIKLKEVKSSEEALKLISCLNADAGQNVIDKTMELWEQHRKSISVELGCH